MNNPLHVSVITTVRHYVGDDFVREGILDLLKFTHNSSSVKNSIAIELIHKHSPVTSVYGMESLRNLRVSRIIEPALRLVGAKNRISDADLLIQSGAPVYWCHPGGSHCSDNEWFDPLIRKRFMKDQRGAKIFEYCRWQLSAISL